MELNMTRSQKDEEKEDLKEDFRRGSGSSLVFYGGYIKKRDLDVFRKILYRSTRGNMFANYFELKISASDTLKSHSNF
jgi:hypothetical protein